VRITLQINGSVNKQ